MPDSPGCVALVATHDRWELLTNLCLPSIRRQSAPPSRVVVVNDGEPLPPAREREIERLLAPIPADVLQNRRAAGAAGAWNTGLEWLRNRADDAFVALLDDDDAWDDAHLERNREAAVHEDADVVVSGLRRVVDGTEIPRPAPRALTPGDFLAGNPGWQGSNTFVTLSLLSRVGGFRDGLASLNDRDLAIRLLRAPGVRVAYTGAWTSTWYVRAGHAALSSPRSAAKISGLRWFWRIYGRTMSPAEAAAFFERAWRCFGVSESEVTDPGDDLPPHTRPRGDL